MIFEASAKIEPQTTLNNGVSKQFCQKTTKKRRELVWNQKENEIYVIFLKENREYFKSQKIRRKEKVFIKLSTLLESRTADQCRSHHQRMMISHKTISRTIKYLEACFEIENKKYLPNEPDESQSHQKERIVEKQKKIVQEKDVSVAKGLFGEDLEEGQLWTMVNGQFWNGVTN